MDTPEVIYRRLPAVWSCDADNQNYYSIDEDIEYDEPDESPVTGAGSFLTQRAGLPALATSPASDAYLLRADQVTQRRPVREQEFKS